MLRRHAIRLIELTAALVLLVGCADYATGNDAGMVQALSASADPARFSEKVTDPTMTAALDSAPAEVPITYNAADAPPVRLLLGAPYVSARGITCRTGRPAGETAVSVFGIFAFCHAPDGWYKTRPILLSNR